MTKKLSDTKSSLRKRLEQQVIVGLTIVLMGFFVTVLNAPAQTREQERTSAPQSIKTTHNTPPPIVVTDGSVIIESGERLTKTSSSGVHYYRSATAPTQIGHIRLLWDNGDIIYADDQAMQSVVMIVWRSNNNVSGTIQIKGGTEFEIRSDGELDYVSEAAKRRTHKYTHNGNGRPSRIESIEITNKNGLKTKFTAEDFTSAAAFRHEGFRLMIWRH